MLLTPVELRCHLGTAGLAEMQQRGDRRFTILREKQIGAHQTQDAPDDCGQDRESIHARVEHAETAWSPDPLLPRVPAADVFLPGHLDLVDLLVG